MAGVGDSNRIETLDERAAPLAFRPADVGFRTSKAWSEELTQQAKSFPATILRIAGLEEAAVGTRFAPVADMPRATSSLSSDPLTEFRAIGLFSLFVGGAWTALHLTSGTRLGMLLGPLAAQLTMALVIFIGARLVLRRGVGSVDGMGGTGVAPSRTRPQRRLTTTPLVLIACGGFLVQAASLAGGRLFVTATIPGFAGTPSAPLAWLVLAATSVLGAPLLEELFFRGMLQPLLSRRNVALGLVTTAALFGLAHGFEMPLRALPAFLQGLVLGGVTLLTGRLRGAVVVHALNNALVLAAATLVALYPERLMHGVQGGAVGWMSSAYAALGLALVAWGFYRMAREPRLAPVIRPL
jgi:membrane protease YdiL (CAAX protease family)